LLVYNSCVRGVISMHVYNAPWLGSPHHYAPSAPSPHFK
jgi:hypothetical protein